MFALVEVGQPDADLVENIHGSCEEQEGGNIWSGRDDGRDDDNRENSVGAGAIHHAEAQNPEVDQGHDNYWKFKGETEDKDESGGKGDIITDAPVIRDAQSLTPVIKEVEDFRQDEKV